MVSAGLMLPPYRPSPEVACAKRRAGGITRVRKSASGDRRWKVNYQQNISMTGGGGYNIGKKNEDD